MADHGDGNIKVVVRCRPLNARGQSRLSVAATPICPAHIGELQSSRVVLNRLFACLEIKHSLIHQS